MAGLFPQKDIFSRKIDEQTAQATARDAANQSRWQKLLTQLAALQNVNGKNLAGLAIGKLLFDAFSSWKNRYDARGEENDYYLTRSDDERNKMLSDMEATNSKRAADIRDYVNKRLGRTDGQINQNVTQAYANGLLTPNQGMTTALERFAEKNLPSTDFLGLGQSSGEKLPTAVLGASQEIQPTIIEGDRVVSGQQGGYQIPILNGTQANQAWAQAQGAPRTLQGSRLATPEEYARVEQGASLDDWREHLERQRQAERALQAMANVSNNALPEVSGPFADPQAILGASQGVQPSAEPARPAEVRDAVSEAAQSQEPNPNQTMFKNLILEQKRRYDNAAQGSQGDRERELAHSRAEMYRALGNEMGYDLKGYGADDTLGEAENALAVQRTRDLLGALQGQYAQNSDQRYEDEYHRAINMGISPKRAQKIAQRAAREYQANRTAYFNQMFNNTGIDGYRLTPQGAQMLAALAKDDPDTANFYANWYPTGREVYANQHEIDKLNLAHRHGFENRADVHKYNELEADSAFKRLARQLELQHGYSKEMAQINAANALGLATHQANLGRETYSYLSDLQARQERARFNENYNRAKLIGLSDEAAMQYAVGGKVSNIDNVSAKDYSGRINALINYRKSITDQYKDSPDGMPADVQMQIASIDQQIGELTGVMGVQGVGQQNQRQQQDQRLFTGNFNEDSKTIAAMRDNMARQGRPWQEIKQIIYEQMIADGCYEPYARGAVGL